MGGGGGGGGGSRKKRYVTKRGYQIKHCRPLHKGVWGSKCSIFPLRTYWTIPLAKMSSRRLAKVTSRCLQDVFKLYHQVKLFLLTRLQDVFNTFSRCTAKTVFYRKICRVHTTEKIKGKQWWIQGRTVRGTSLVNVFRKNFILQIILPFFISPVSEILSQET